LNSPGALTPCEHGVTAGTHAGYRESTWVPLIIVGEHPRLPRGPQEGVAGLVDVAPTVAGLIGLRYLIETHRLHAFEPITPEPPAQVEAAPP
jgi:arylsulfatase A-like enzyme